MRDGLGGRDTHADGKIWIETMTRHHLGTRDLVDVVLANGQSVGVKSKAAAILKSEQVELDALKVLKP